MLSYQLRQKLRMNKKEKEKERRERRGEIVKGREEKEENVVRMGVQRSNKHRLDFRHNRDFTVGLPSNLPLSQRPLVCRMLNICISNYINVPVIFQPVIKFKEEQFVL